MVPVEANKDPKDPKQQYAADLQKLSDDDLREEVRQQCWLSAYAQNNPRSKYHWQCDATYDEAKRRDKPTLYSEGHKLACKDAGF
jgi:hypothetical protein